MSPRVVLVGLPGTGKSTSGRRLAKIMCVPFVDSDELIEAAEGRTVAEIFATGGEAAFRAAEHSAVAALPRLGLRRRAVARRRRGHPPRRPARPSSTPACRSRCCTRRARHPAGQGRRRPHPAAARRRPAGAAARARRRAHPDLRRDRHADRRHRPTAPRARSPRTSPPGCTSSACSRDDPDHRRRRRAVRRPRRARPGRPSWRRCSPAPRASPSSTPPSCAASAAALRDTLDPEVLLVEVPDGEDAKTLAVAGSCWDRLGAGGFHPLRRDRRARRGSDHRPRRLGRGRLAARGAGGAGADHPGRHGRRRGRRQDRHQHRPRQEPGRRVPPAGRGAVRPRHARHAAGRRLRRRPRRGGQVRLHRRPGDPRPDRGRPGRRRPCPARRSSASWSSAPCGSRPRWSARTSPSRAAARSSTTATPSATRSSAPRATAGATARRSRSAWSTPPRSAAGSAASTPPPRDRHRSLLDALGLPTTYRPDAFAELLDTMRIDKKARANRLRFIVLDGLARPGTADGPDPEVLAAAYEEVARRA